MDQLKWLAVVVVAVAALFGLLLWFQREIPPTDRDPYDDDWITKTRG